LFAALGEAMDSPFRFDNETPYASREYPYWMISLSTLLVAVIPILVGAWSGAKTWLQTRELFTVNALLATMGASGLLAMALALYRLSQTRIESRFYYYGMDVGASGSLIFTVFASIVFGLCILGFGVIYTSGVVSEGSGKYDRQPDEVDPLGQMIEEQVRQKSLRS
jgi:hypothetical protein